MMCGIAGAFSYASATPPGGLDFIDPMAEALRARGPDTAGVWESEDARVRLGHRRLSILDPSPAGNQPMVHEASGCVLVFNGEIYNFRELRAGLDGSGEPFRSTGDSEVLLRGYLAWGEELLPELRGMFSFALWDPRRRSLWAARDPYGIKPFYYVDRGGRFTFASQVRPLRDFAGADTDPDPAGVVGMLLLGSVPEPYTCHRGIRALPAGHAVTVSGNGCGEPRPYASISDVWRGASASPHVVDAQVLSERVRTAVRESVRAHQVSDVPVGAFLSGGIDSGALVGVMATPERDAPLRTVTLGFASFRGGPADETGVAAAVSERFGTDHHTVWIEDRDVEGDLPTVLRDMDQPSVDGLNTWLVSKHTAALGLKVVISGLGGDELFGGYSNFTELPRWRRRIRRLSSIPGLLPAAAVGARVGSGLGLFPPKTEALARMGPDMAGLYMTRRGLFMPWELDAVLDGDLVREGLECLRPPDFVRDTVGAWPHSDYASVAALNTALYLRNQLLRDSDWASMAHSLELRTPLVDLRLLETLAPLLVERPDGMEGKRPLALVPESGLPAAVLRRSKSGFSLPMARWIKRSEVLDAWRRNRAVETDGCAWAKRFAYSVLAVQFPEAMVRA